MTKQIRIDIKKALPRAFFLFFCLWSITLKAQFGWTIFNMSNSPLPSNIVNCVAFADSNTVWIGTDNGLMRKRDTSWVLYNTGNSGLSGNDISELRMRNDGSLWISVFANGIDIYKSGVWTHINNGNSPLPDDQVADVSFDEGDTSVWISTGGGVSHLKDTSWTIFNMIEYPLYTNNFTKTIILKDTQWVGTVNGGLNRHYMGFWKDYRIINSGLLDNTILDLEHDSEGNLWMSTAYAGLVRFDKGSGWFYRQMANSSIATNSLTKLAVSPADVKYVGSFDKGLMRWEGGLQWIIYDPSNSPMPGYEVKAIEIQGDSTIWIGTDLGLAILRDTMPHRSITGMHEIRDIAAEIYPNPCKDHIYINWNNTISEPASFQLYSSSGDLVLQTELIGQTSKRISLKGIAPGIYFYSLEENNKLIQRGKLAVSE